MPTIALLALPFRPAILLAILLLQGCNNSPTENFEKRVTESESSSNDRFPALSAPPRLRILAVWKGTEHIKRLQLELDGFRDRYADSLRELENSEDSALIPEECMKSFKDVLSFLDSTGVVGSPVSRANSISSKLNTCRLETLRKLSEKETPFPNQQYLPRFASSGMVLVAVRLITLDEVSRGTSLWTEANVLVDEDRASFEITLKSLRGF